MNVRITDVDPYGFGQVWATFQRTDIAAGKIKLELPNAWWRVVWIGQPIGQTVVSSCLTYDGKRQVGRTLNARAVLRTVSLH